jgi:DNA repair exonuclease SbcCD ATPase subunit
MIGVIVTVVLAVLTAFSSLIWIIRRGDIRRITTLEEAFKAIRSHTAQLVKLDEKIIAFDKTNRFLEDLHSDLEKLKTEVAKDKEQLAVSSKSILYLEENLRRMTDTIEKLREEMKDVVVTINGFGRDYITRKECNDQCRFKDSGVKK